MSPVVGAALILSASTASAQQPAAAPPPPPPYGTPITLEQAKKVMAGAEAEAKKNSWNAVMVVLDSGGNLVMLQRMDAGQFGSIEIAKEKAYSAVAFRRPTKAFDDALAQGGANLRILRLPGASPVEGGIPIVVDGKLIGAVGVSGDGIDQDDMVAFLGLANAASALNTGIANAPSAIRADQIVPQGTGTRLRYVNCPQTPFNNSTQQNVCEGL